MPFIASFIALSIGGILDAGYLFFRHYQKKSLVCPLNHDCSVVTESKWATVLGIRNETLGFFFYVTMLASMLGSIIFPAFAPIVYMFLVVATTVGVGFSLILVYIQIFLIKDYCFYCLISAFITLLLFLNSLKFVFGKV